MEVTDPPHTGQASATSPHRISLEAALDGWIGARCCFRPFRGDRTGAMATSKAERRQALLKAARDVFATKGYHDAKVDDIVALAEVAKGTFYLYFPDKRSIFSELVDTLFHRLGAAILQVDPAGDVDAQVKH